VPARSVSRGSSYITALHAEPMACHHTGWYLPACISRSGVECFTALKARQEILRTPRCKAWVTDTSPPRRKDRGPRVRGKVCLRKRKRSKSPTLKMTLQNIVYLESPSLMSRARDIRHVIVSPFSPSSTKQPTPPCGEEGPRHEHRLLPGEWRVFEPFAGGTRKFSLLLGDLEA
jgi:hypothetical protein